MTPIGTRTMRLLPLPLLVLAMIAVGPQTTATSSSATCTGKCALGMLSAGASSPLSFTLTNEASSQDLGSANLSAPSGVVIDPPVSMTSNGFANTTATAQVSGGTLLLRNLSIPPGDSVTVQFGACGAASSSPWSLVAKQANNFNGSPGNNFVIDPASVLVAPAGDCVLTFVTGHQPTNALAQQDITSAGFQPSGAPLEVEASDGHGTPFSGVSISMSLVSPGGVSATLGGTLTSVTGANGVASWSNLTLDHNGYFQVTASATGFTSVTSNVFLIAQTAQVCSTGSCSTPPLSSKTTTATITALNLLSAGDILSAGLGGYTYGCQAPAQGGYASVTDPVGFDVWQSNGTSFDPAASSQVTIEVSKQAVQISPNNGAAFYEICYASNVSFATRPGTTLGSTTIPGSSTPFYYGLLPDCGSNPAPCVVSRHKGNAGAVLITFDSAPGDLWGRS